MLRFAVRAFGFAAALAFCSAALAQAPDTILLNESPLLRQHVNLEHVNKLIGEHVARTHNHNHLLWGLINLAAWHKIFVLDNFEGKRGRREASEIAARATV